MTKGQVHELLRLSTVAAVLAGAFCTLVGLVVRGWPGLWGGLLATGMVVGFLLVGQLPVARPVQGRGCLAAGLLLALYVLRVLLLIVVYALIVNVAGDEVDDVVVGLTVIVTALAWTGATVWTAVRWRPTLIDPDD